MGRKSDGPYRLREVRECADRLAQSRAWHVFISYARDPDSSVALQLRRYVMGVARPWLGFSNLRVFLDKEAMLPGSALPEQIAGILSASSALALLACPASAKSAWVGTEVVHWREECGERPLVVVRTGGVLNYHPPEAGGGIDWVGTTALDEASFAGKRTGEQPRTFWVDELAPVAQRLAGTGDMARATALPGRSRLSQAWSGIWAGRRLRHGHRAALRRAALAVVAGALGLERDRLAAFERRRRGLLTAVIATVVLGMAALSATTVIGQVQRRHADEAALSRQLAAASSANTLSDPDLAGLLAVAAYRTSPTDEASGAVVLAASAPLWRVLRGHTAAVTSVAAAGTVAITGSEDGTAHVWDTRTGASIYDLRPGCGPVRQVLVADDARLALTVCHAVARSWDLTSGASLRSFTLPGASFMGAAYSSQQHVAVVEGSAGTAWLWDPHSGALLHTLSGHTDQVTAAAFTADGALLATGDAAGGVRLWDTATGALQGMLSAAAMSTPLATYVSELAFTHDGKTLAAADNDHTASLWDVAARRRTHLLTGASSGVTSVAIAPDDSTIATASLDGSVRTWDTATGTLLRTIDTTALGIWSVRYSPDGRTLLTVSENHTAAVWDARSGTLDARLVGHTDAVRKGEFCPDGSCVITADAAGTARLWSTANISGRRSFDPGLKSLRGLVEGSGQTVLGTIAESGPALLLDPRTLTDIRRLDVGPGGQAIDISPDATTVATGGDDYVLRLWDSATGRQLWAHADHTEAISHVVFSPDGTQIATASYDETVRLWDAHTGALLHVLHGAWKNPWVLTFSPNSDLLATSYQDDHVQIWDPRSGALLRVLTSPFPIPNHSTAVATLAFSPDGSLLAVGGQNHAVCLWNPRTGKLVRALREATDDIREVEFSPDGNQIAAAGDEPVARVWDVASGRQLFVLGGFTGDLTSLDYSREGRLLAIAGYDGSLRFFDATTGQLLEVVHLNLGFASVLFDPNGAALHSEGFDGVLRTWDSPPATDTAASAVCAAVGRDLTDLEWKRYAPGPKPVVCHHP